MKIYFQDLNEDTKSEIFSEVIEKLKIDTDYKQEAKDSDMTEEDWLSEEADDYINTHDFGCVVIR